MIKLQLVLLNFTSLITSYLHISQLLDYIEFYFIFISCNVLSCLYYGVVEFIIIFCYLIVYVDVISTYLCVNKEYYGQQIPHHTAYKCFRAIKLHQPLCHYSRTVIIYLFYSHIFNLFIEFTILSNFVYASKYTLCYPPAPALCSANSNTQYSRIRECG